MDTVTDGKVGLPCLLNPWQWRENSLRKPSSARCFNMRRRLPLCWMNGRWRRLLPCRISLRIAAGNIWCNIPPLCHILYIEESDFFEKWQERAGLFLWGDWSAIHCSGRQWAFLSACCCPALSCSGSWWYFFSLSDMSYSDVKCRHKKRTINQSSFFAAFMFGNQKRRLKLSLLCRTSGRKYIRTFSELLRSPSLLQTLRWISTSC